MQGGGMENNSRPLAWSQNGDPIELPQEATLWRVRRLNGGPKGGAPEIVYGVDGLPLTVAIDTTAEDFAEAVERRSGKYRLDSLNEERKALLGVAPAYVMVGGSGGREAPEEDKGTVERMVRTLTDALRTQGAQITALVDAAARLIASAEQARAAARPETAALVPVTSQPVAAAEPEPVATQAQAPSAPPSNWFEAFVGAVGKENLPALVEAVPSMVGGLLSLFKKPEVAPAVTPPPPTAPEPAGGES
jgi:hypothetical protein